MIELGMLMKLMIIICVYCGVGCMFKVEMCGDELVWMVFYKYGKVNCGYFCVKGWFVYGYVIY